MTDKTLEELLSELDELRKNAAQPKKAKRRIPKGWIVVALVLLFAGGVVAAVLFTHTLPSPTAGIAALSNSCTGVGNALTVTPLTMPTNSAGNALVGCNSPQTAVVTSASSCSSTAPCSAIPAFALPVGVTGLDLVTATANCPPTGAPTPAFALLPTTAISITIPSQGYYYCVVVGSFTAWSGFTVQWSQ